MSDIKMKQRCKVQDATGLDLNLGLALQLSERGDEMRGCDWSEL